MNRSLTRRQTSSPPTDEQWQLSLPPTEVRPRIAHIFDKSTFRVEFFDDTGFRIVNFDRTSTVVGELISTPSGSLIRLERARTSRVAFNVFVGLAATGGFAATFLTFSAHVFGIVFSGVLSGIIAAVIVQTRESQARTEVTDALVRGLAELRESGPYRSMG